MYAYIKHADSSLEFVEIIPIGITGGVPPRPHPSPTPPGPVDPGYSPPWAQLPVDPGYGIPIGGVPHPSHPIALPGDPWWGQDLKPTHPIMLPGMPGWPENPPPTPPVMAVIVPLPPQTPPETPPVGMPPDSTKILVWYGPGTKPAVAWVAPYASTGPVTPPSA